MLVPKRWKADSLSWQDPESAEILAVAYWTRMVGETAESLMTAYAEDHGG